MPRVGWEPGEDGLIVLLVPKFRWGPFAGWLMAHIAKPHVRVKLDRFGSFFFRQIDGATPMSVVVERIRREFGAEAEPVEERAALFLRRLERGDLVEPGPSAPPAGEVAPCV